MLAAYLGSDERYYQDYLDASTGRMLVAAPGGTYDVLVAPGRVPGLPLPPGDGRWGAASPPQPQRLPAPGPDKVAPSALPAQPATSGGQPAPSPAKE